MNVEKEDISPCLRAQEHQHPPVVMYAVDMGGGKSAVQVTEQLSPTLTTTHGGEPAVMYEEDSVQGFDSYNQTLTGGVSMTLRAAAGNLDACPKVLYEHYSD